MWFDSQFMPSEQKCPHCEMTFVTMVTPKMGLWYHRMNCPALDAEQRAAENEKDRAELEAWLNDVAGEDS